MLEDPTAAPKRLGMKQTAALRLCLPLAPNKWAVPQLEADISPERIRRFAYSRIARAWAFSVRQSHRDFKEPPQSCLVPLIFHRCGSRECAISRRPEFIPEFIPWHQTL